LFSRGRRLAGPGFIQLFYPDGLRLAARSPA